MRAKRGERGEACEAAERATVVLNLLASHRSRCNEMSSDPCHSSGTSTLTTGYERGLSLRNDLY